MILRQLFKTRQMQQENSPVSERTKVYQVSSVSKLRTITVIGLVYGGLCNYHLGQYEEAILHYDEAKKHQGEPKVMAEIYYNRGLANSSLMRFEEAIKDHNRAIDEMNDNQKVFKMRF